jgi:hypothetical protein
MKNSSPVRAMIRVAALVLGSICIECAVLDAKAPTDGHANANQAGVQELTRSAQAARVERAPKLDGTLSDPLWQSAVPISNFLQREPFEGHTPTEETEVRVLYDRQQVYFGISCLDSEPNKIIATELRRDVSQELDDYFEIVIDSAHDRRNAYVFQINPLGTQRDALITEEQRTESSGGDGDPGWDGVWTSEARIAKGGWTATVAIPFSSLNFMQTNHLRTLSVYVGRSW